VSRLVLACAIVFLVAGCGANGQEPPFTVAATPDLRGVLSELDASINYLWAMPAPRTVGQKTDDLADVVVTSHPARLRPTWVARDRRGHRIGAAIKADTEHRIDARGFVALLVSPIGQRAFRDYGFRIRRPTI
jgi:hypothetical protein